MGEPKSDGPRKALVVCGPTASGKSDLADALADALSELYAPAPAIVVDSMQVYREIPIITNQARRRPAELVGIVPVTEEWTVARHRAAADDALGRTGAHRFVLDAGTGMYLNAILLDIPMAPKVPADLRRRAQEETSADEQNPRRASRAKELALAGAGERGSIWDGRPRYEPAIVYLRPERPRLDDAIAARSRKISREGVEEAEALQQMARAGARINPSVTESVGVRELTQYLSGGLSLGEAEDRINVRTRQLARRQMRWFDKLVSTLRGRAHLSVLDGQPDDETGRRIMHGMHDIMG